MNVSFAKATPGDQISTQHLIARILEEYDLKLDLLTTDRDLLDLQASYFAAGGWFEKLLDSNGEIIGTWGLLPISESSCELRKMYLERSYRGQGLGRQMLERALQKARELGFSVVDLETANALKAAKELYCSYGFRKIESDHLSSRCDEAYRLIL